MTPQYSNNNHDLLIGSCASVGNYSYWSRFNGLVDDLFLYKIALTESEFKIYIRKHLVINFLTTA